MDAKFLRTFVILSSALSKMEMVNGPLFSRLVLTHSHMRNVFHVLLCACLDFPDQDTHFLRVATAIPGNQIQHRLV